MTIELELEAAPDSEGNRGLLTRRDVRAALALARIVHPPREALSCLSAGAGVVLCEECKNLHFLVTARAPDPLFYSDGPSKKLAEFACISAAAKRRHTTSRSVCKGRRQGWQAEAEAEAEAEAGDKIKLPKQKRRKKKKKKEGGEQHSGFPAGPPR